MLTVGDKFPDFSKTAVLGNNDFDKISSEDHRSENQWMVIFWYPKDFTFICQTEIVEFNNQYDRFLKLNTGLYSASTDTEDVHLAWKLHDKKLTGVRFPMIADTSKSLGEALGILQPDKVAFRATFIVDPEGIIQWVCVNNDNTGRSVAEVLRALAAIQTKAKTPCEWVFGQDTY